MYVVIRTELWIHQSVRRLILRIDVARMTPRHLKIIGGYNCVDSSMVICISQEIKSHFHVSRLFTWKEIRGKKRTGLRYLYGLFCFFFLVFFFCISVGMTEWGDVTRLEEPAWSDSVS